MNLLNLGWTPALDDYLLFNFPGLSPAKVREVNRSEIGLIAENGEITGVQAGRLRHSDQSLCVGDWVAGDFREERFFIQHILPRKSFVRRVSPSGQTQSICSNIDELWILMSCNQDFNLARLERYVGLAFASKVKPVAVITKSDLVEDRSTLETALARIPKLEVVWTSVHRPETLNALAKKLGPGFCAALVGSSGVGKSSLTNVLLHRSQVVAEIRDSDGKGRHTTTKRSLMLAPNGAGLIDTPGMRELGLENSEALVAFEDIEAAAKVCKFSDCSHEAEPNCGIRLALETGAISLDRWNNYQKLQREILHLERKRNKALQSEQKEIWKKRTMNYRKSQKYKWDY